MSIRRSILTWSAVLALAAATLPALTGESLAAASTVPPAAPAFHQADSGTRLAAPGSGAFVSLLPARVLDTRSALGANGPVRSQGEVALQISGRGGVPAAGVSAVTLNVTATAATGRGYLTVYPDGSSRPTGANVNFTVAAPASNLVVVQVGANGKIRIHNGTAGGSVQLVAEVVGYYVAGAPVAAGAFRPVAGARVMDTRSRLGAAGPVGSQREVVLQISGRGGVPQAGASSVALNVTVTAPQGRGFLTVFPDGIARPTAANLNFAAGQNVTNLVVVRIGANGSIRLYNGTAGGSVQLIADVVGYFRTGEPTAPGTFKPITPARLVDTRTNVGASGPVRFRSSVAALVAGRGGVPGTGVAAVAVNLTAVQPVGVGFLTAYPDGTAQPVGASPNFAAGQSTTNLVVVPVGANGKLRVFNGSATGSVQVIADVVGYYLTTPDTTPPGPVTAPTISGVTKTALTLHWTNPTAPDFAGVSIRRAVGATPPATPTAGTLVADLAAPATSYVNSGLTPGTRYSYALFAHDRAPNYAGHTTLTATTHTATAAMIWGAPVSVDPNQGALRDVSCASPTFCLAVDSFGSAVRYVGTAWSAPSHVDLNQLSSVSCPTTMFCMAVDISGAALTFNGSKWSHPVRVVSSDLAVVSCSSPTFCAAVTTNGEAAQFNGISWGAVGGIYSGDGYIVDVSCASSSFCVAADLYGETMRFDGHTWTVPANYPTGLASVSCVSSSFCVGVTGGAVVTFDGSVWSAPVTVDPDQGLGSVSCPTVSFCVAVDTYSGTEFRFNGVRWTAPAVVHPGLSGFISISCPTTAFCAVVNYSSDAAQMRGTTWTAAAGIDPLRANLQGVSCLSAGFCLAVDGSGNAMKWNGVNWTAPAKVDPSPSGGFTDVSCAATTFCLAVDTTGNALLFNGVAWSAPVQIDSSGGLGLTAVSCPSSSFCAAVSSSGNVITFNGTSWAAPIPVDPGTGSGFSDVSCPSTSFCVAVGRSGRGSIFRNGVWSAAQVIDPTSNPGLSSVSCPSPTFCIATQAYSHGAFRYNGTAWTELPNLTPSYFGFNAVSCPSATFCVAVDYLGSVATYGGRAWSPPVAVIADDLSAVSCPEPTMCIAVTYSGQVLRGS